MTSRLIRGLLSAMGRVVPVGHARLRRREAPVAEAAMPGDREAVRALLKQGEDVNAAQGDGMTALHWAAQVAATSNSRRCCSTPVRNVKAMTRLGGYTPLMMASADRRTRR